MLELCWIQVGPCWVHVGATWSSAGTTSAHVRSKLGLGWPMLGLCWGCNSLSGPMLAHLGAMLGLCWPSCGLCWGQVRPSWGYVGAMLAHLESMLGPCSPILGSPGGDFGAMLCSWAHLHSHYPGKRPQTVLRCFLVGNRGCQVRVRICASESCSATSARCLCQDFCISSL